MCAYVCVCVRMGGCECVVVLIRALLCGERMAWESSGREWDLTDSRRTPARGRWMGAHVVQDKHISSRKAFGAAREKEE